MTERLSTAYRGKKVLITGHTGFKGGWLSLWLTSLGAEVYGYALEPPTTPSLFELLELAGKMHHEVADIRDLERLKRTIRSVAPDIVFHLAAQSLVRESYAAPLETVQANTLGTVHLLEAVRQTGVSTALVLVTTDKVYENKEWLHGYREPDALGGHDPYSSSKAAAEILLASWRSSFFHPSQVSSHGVRVASARAGNVVGGGDWSTDRIVPDCIRDLEAQRAIGVRNPYATRPWQHVLEPLAGYLELGARLLEGTDAAVASFCEAFNFGPHTTSNRSVGDLVDKVVRCWGSGSWEHISPEVVHHEASLLHLTIDKAYHRLHWSPKWDFDRTIEHTVAWYQHARQHPTQICDFTLQQIRLYEAERSEGGGAPAKR